MGAHRNHAPRKFTIKGIDANTRTMRRSAIVFWYRSPCMPSPVDVSGRRLDRAYSSAIRAIGVESPIAHTFTHPSPPPQDLYRHLHRIAGRISIALAAEAIVIPEVRVETRPALTTLVPTLDRILGPFEAGKITLIDSGSDFVSHLTTLLSGPAVMEGHEVVFLDGGNSVDPHGMVALGKRAAL